jgi:hypothetical protein
MHNVLSSAGEAKFGALFHIAQDGCPLRVALHDMGHACADSIVNDTIKQKRSTAMDMRFYWVRDRSNQGQFLIHWRKGSDNQADYFTKHHPPAHHQLQRPLYLHTGP